jgi:hypothetical protein
MKIIMKRIIIAIISWFVFSIIVGVTSFIPLDERSQDIYYLSFLEEFVYAIVYGTPFYILILVPTSLLVDFLYTKIFNSKINEYFFKIVSYSLIGLVVGLMLPSDITDIIFMIFSCLLFVHSFLLLRKPLKV